LFGHFAIGKNPTSLNNRYLTLKWDFSCVDPIGDVDDIRNSLHDRINACIKAFIMYYRDYLTEEIRVDRTNAITSILSLVTLCPQKRAQGLSADRRIRQLCQSGDD